ncbi:hypothetical protein ANI01nite_29120 [Glutamicibacter nicotianae]|uniref:Uncharacterized protein n=1 Tax=Glutamicibacter nicotianae TaxID=37929 RepID=A0ABQ0RPH7_GLUNI|nr:hypothetical protein ANI01nite_29120 [Glutamicibacter nicotianae]
MITAIAEAITQASRPSAVKTAKMAVASTIATRMILASMAPTEVLVALAKRLAAGDSLGFLSSVLDCGPWWAVFVIFQMSLSIKCS